MTLKTTPKDFFLHLAALITLYLSLISFLNLGFAIINHFFPDSLQYFDFGFTRVAIASLIILFPLHVYLSNLINKDIILIPEKKTLWIKKWSTYLTLFLTGAIIAGDLIILITTFLGGEISMRFIMKVLLVLLTASFVFYVYFYELKRIQVDKDMKWNYLWYGASIAVLIFLIGGFVASGSPFSERQRRFDDQRVQDLTTIQYQITNYYQSKNELPKTLTDLNDPLSSFQIPMDPESKQSYEYKNISTNSFELCANFNLPSRVQNQPAIAPGQIPSVFIHGSGRVCFLRTIDPAFYPPRTKN